MAPVGSREKPPPLAALHIYANSVTIEAGWRDNASVETNASPAFAWNYWTDVANWADPPAKFDHSESCAWFFTLTSASSRLLWTDTPRQCRINVLTNRIFRRSVTKPAPRVPPQLVERMGLISEAREGAKSNGQRMTWRAWLRYWRSRAWWQAPSFGWLFDPDGEIF